MSSPKLRSSAALVLFAVMLAACDDDENRIAGAGVGFGASAFQNRLGGFSTASPDAALALIGDVDGDGVADYAIGDAAAGTGGEVTIRSGASHAPIRTIASPIAQAGFGGAVATAGDVDADGSTDLLVGAANVDPAGAAYVVSGRTGAILRQLVAGNQAPVRLGTSVATIGDANGDGVRDHAVGASGLASPTSVALFSGQDGSLLDTLEFASDPVVGNGPTGMFGIDDVTGDGVDDVVLGFDGPQTPVLNGATAATVRQHPGRSLSAASVGDLNSDGTPDYAIGYPNRNDLRGQVEVFSGSNGSRLYVLEGVRGGGELGHSVAGIGDQNDDGVGDILVGGRGYARLFSGANGQPIGEQNAADPGAIVRVQSLGDLDGDGAIDYAIATGTEVTVFSGDGLMLAADRFELSVATGGTQTMTIDAGPDNAGRLYFVFGSVSGVSPGVDLGSGLRLPLNPDAYTNHTATQVPSNAVFVNFVSSLDENGRGQAALNVPPGLPPGLAGVTLYHAGMISVIQGPVATTNPVSLTFTP